MFNLEELFGSIDDFCTLFEPGWKQQLLTQGKCRLRDRRLSLSQIMTIEIAFHLSAYKSFKTFYLEIVSFYWREAVLVRVPLRKSAVMGVSPMTALFQDAPYVGAVRQLRWTDSPA